MSSLFDRFKLRQARNEKANELLKEYDEKVYLPALEKV